MDSTDDGAQRGDADALALVLVRASSPFLPNAVLAQREQRCAALAGAVAGTVQVVPRASGVVSLIDAERRAPGRLVVVTWHAGGIVTSAAELEAVIGLLAVGVTVFEAQTGQLVEVSAHQLAAAARPPSTTGETVLHAARTREGRHAVAREGGWLGGRCPLGWQVDADGDVVLDVVAARFIRTGTLQVIGGTKVGIVVAQWNAAGFTTLSGRAWTFGSARRVLLRARNAGLSEYRGAVVGRSSWPAIVSVADWRRARALLAPRPERRIA